MELFYTCQKSKVVAMYLTNSRPLSHFTGNNRWHCLGDVNSLPILNSINISTNHQVTLASGKNDYIDIQNRKCSLTQVSTGVLIKSKIDIATNDLLAGPVKLVFNFTGTPLTLTPLSGVATTFPPLVLENLTRDEGKLVFMNIHTLKIPESVASNYIANNNFLIQMRDEYATNKDLRSIEIREIYDYVIKVLASSVRQSSELVSDTYKVATMTVVDVNRIFETEDFKEKRKDTISINNLATYVTRLAGC